MARFAVLIAIVVFTALVNSTPVNDSNRLLGRWELESSENFEEYMVAIGVEEAMRKVALNLKQTNVISRDGDVWTIRMESTVRNTELKFTEGVEFDEDRLDGKKLKSTVTSEGPSKLVQVEKDVTTGTVLSTITREVNDKDELVTLLKSGDVTCTRVYKRVL